MTMTGDLEKSKHRGKKGAFGEREIAKAGMVTSLGAVLLTGLVRFRGARLLHPWAGLALLGFSLWHHFLNRGRRK